ncbi:hypothetical protein JTE90_015434 [Oedothorax gibbosus]|uniref:Uncharacterized protein n=1 Tax=Oedothorax gibbosus TaxID=931172 RepID=A0AAV6TCR2_9ARAC|nr:hypothetical protein JTE90_015434 [Oedothorax gibbosus]
MVRRITYHPTVEKADTLKNYVAGRACDQPNYTDHLLQRTQSRLIFGLIKRSFPTSELCCRITQYSLELSHVSSCQEKAFQTIEGPPPQRAPVLIIAPEILPQIKYERRTLGRRFSQGNHHVPAALLQRAEPQG